ncbi:hypothetical protein [Legionella resiliens]|uniref:Ferric reductase like transmembrane component n=1 Tax=Legionella resiliens TaxID=2905958 RepID=A0ABS8X370_9GAMM|nr:MULTISPECIES: hypothetical protein [unclassified Legionella]MCE0722762.1 hypothetical protein [Legionella sp. 9fVS26]MCE3531915.1 hypothetical protein [Legionella sp. 8cVS16]
MNAPGRLMALGLMLLMMMTWLGFTVHVSPRFAGSLWGGVIGMSGALLMLVPLLYLFIKRIPILKHWITQYVSMNTLLSWHIYAGIIGPILVLIHTGHKFQSALGIALTGMTLIVTISGFVGRYLLSFIADEVREKKELLSDLQSQYQRVAQEIQTNPDLKKTITRFHSMSARFAAWLFNENVLNGESTAPASLRALRLVESIAELEYAIQFHEQFRRAFRTWLRLHIVIALVLYGLLALHVWSGIYFGLRWFQ